MIARPAIEYVYKIANPSNIQTSSYLTPLKVSSAYNIPASNGAGVKVGIISFGGGWQQSDLDLSMADMGLPSPTINQVLIGGATNNFSLNDFSIENTLDIYCVAAIAPSANIRIYIAPNNISYLFDAVVRAKNDGCDIITISWLSDEYPDFLPYESAWAELANQGITVLAASGDYGSAEQDRTNKGVGYPASSAYVSAIGGTTLIPYSSGGYTEYPSTGSGGGISSIFPRPSYQDGATYRTYDKNTRITGPVTALPRRGVPDFSAPMNGYAFYCGGSQIAVGGTSASAPVMAGMVARINALTGKRQGLLNTKYYRTPSAFNDFSSGHNSLIFEGYAVTSAWDPVVGLGRPYGQSVYAIANGIIQKTKIKDTDGQWKTASNVFVKTQTLQWEPVKTIWLKTDSGWQQTY